MIKLADVLGEPPLRRGSVLRTGRPVESLEDLLSILAEHCLLSPIELDFVRMAARNSIYNGCLSRKKRTLYHCLDILHSNAAIILARRLLEGANNRDGIVEGNWKAFGLH